MIWHHRELSIARESCTEPLAREILELQEKLKGLEQAKVDWEDCIALTRSEVSSHLPHLSNLSKTCAT